MLEEGINKPHTHVASSPESNSGYTAGIEGECSHHCTKPEKLTNKNDFRKGLPLQNWVDEPSFHPSGQRSEDDAENRWRNHWILNEERSSSHMSISWNSSEMVLHCFLLESTTTIVTSSRFGWSCSSFQIEHYSKPFSIENAVIAEMVVPRLPKQLETPAAYLFRRMPSHQFQGHLSLVPHG